MKRKERIPPCPHCGTIAVHGNIADCVPVLKAQRDEAKALLERAHEKIERGGWDPLLAQIAEFLWPTDVSA